MYGPVRTVVGEGRSREVSPYPDRKAARRVPCHVDGRVKPGQDEEVNLPFGSEHEKSSVIVIVVEADAGAAGLAGLAADRQMPHYFDLDGDLAGRRRHTLTDPDGNPGGDVFPRAQRGGPISVWLYGRS